MSTTDFSSAPRLAVGSHPNSKTYKCAMNVISWENGDTVITDTPSCTPRPLAAMVQFVNDQYCQHTTEEADPDTGRPVRVLCASCSMKVLDLAHRTVHVPSVSMSGAWGWVASLLDKAHRTVHSDGEAVLLHEALKVALAYAEGRQPECPAPPRLSLGTSYMAELAKQIISSERAKHPRPGRVPSYSRWVSVGMTEEFVSVTPHGELFKMMVGNTFDEMAAGGIVPGAHYLPEHHHVVPQRNLLDGAGRMYVLGLDNRNVLLSRAHEAIDLWISNVFRPAPAVESPKENVSA